MRLKIKVPLPVKMGLVVLVLGFATILLAIFLTGCSSSKKDAKAVQRVQNSTELTKKILDNFPCNNDTTLVHDTTIVTNERTDTVKTITYKTVKDTVYVQEVQILTKWKDKIKTETKLIKDDRQVKALEQELNNEEGQRLAGEDRIDELKGDLRKANFQKWLTWILLIIGVIFGLYLKLKPKLKF